MSKTVTAMKSRTVYNVEGFNSPVHVIENTDSTGSDIQVIFQRKDGSWRTAPQDGTLYQNISKMWFAPNGVMIND